MGKQIVSKFDSHQKKVLKKKGGKSLPSKSKKIRKKIIKSDGFKEKLEELKRNWECQDLKTKILTHPTSKRQYLTLAKWDGDLFNYDDLKARPDQFTNFSYIHIVFDEIMLEGLDGITLEALWKRLGYTLKTDLIPWRLQELFWQLICLNEKIKVYKLPCPREDLVLPRSDDEIYSDLPYIYSTNMPEKQALTTTNWGCCVTLNQRVDISVAVRTMTLKEASSYGNLLVFVADTELRRNILLGEIADPTLEILPNDYCLLELIGRARDYGMTTLGPAALHHLLKLDSRTLFLQLQRLIKEHVLTKQYFFDRFLGYDNKVKSGRLYHLRRFYFRKKSQYQVIIENIVDYLKKCPDYRAPYRTVKARFFSHSPKVAKFPEFVKHLDSSVKLPVSEVFKSVEHMMLHGIRPRETVVQLLRLRDPFVNVQASWRHEVQGDESPDEEEEDEGSVSNLRNRRAIYNRDVLRDVYLYILSKGQQGAVTAEVHRHFEWDFAFARMIIKRLCSRSLVKVTKRDIGNQTTNHYVALAALANPDIEINKKIDRPRDSKVLEKIKMRQKKKLDSTPKELIYTLDQYKMEKTLQNPQRPPVTFPLPQITCKFLIQRFHLATPEVAFNVLTLKTPQNLFKPFTINLTVPSVASDIPRQLLEPTLNSKQTFLLTFDASSEVLCLEFKPCAFTKSFLLKSFLDNLRINSPEVLELLSVDGGGAKEAQKRPLEEIQVELEPDLVKNIKLLGSVSRQMSISDIMGGEEVLVHVEKNHDEFVIETYASKAKEELKKGDISKYIPKPGEPSMTDRYLSRIKFVLNFVQDNKVVDNINTLTREIQNFEDKRGYKKKIDKRTLWRIYQKLVAEGYLVIYKILFYKGDFRRMHTFVCHPDITFDHSILQWSLEQKKDYTINQEFVAAGGAVKQQKTDEPGTSRVPLSVSSQAIKSTYFTGADILKSLTEIRQISGNAHKPPKLRMSGKMGKYYGRKPKFAALAIIHELIFYLVYELDKQAQPISKEEVAGLFRTYRISLTDEELARLPPVYCKEISWRTFIPPMPTHWQWENGWMLLADVILRMPLLLIAQCHTITFVCEELQDVLKHPIKRLYQLRYQPATIQSLLSNRRRLVQTMHTHMIMLGYLGLVQFGPTTFNDRNKSFFYINRKASLWDTTSSEPGFFTIEEKAYPVLRFYFNGTEDVMNFWSTMHHICINTNLTNRSGHVGERYTIIDPTCNPGLMKARTFRTYKDAPKYDLGDLPGDHKGAAGLDSSFWSHLRRSWVMLLSRSTPLFAKSFDKLKLDDLVDTEANFDNLKLLPNISGQKMIPPEKYFLSKQKPSESLPPRPQFRPLAPRTTKKTPVLKKTVMPRKEPTGVVPRHDAVDRALKRKYPKRYRPRWTGDEDRVLILMKIADIFISPGTFKQMVSYATMRDVIHIVCPSSRDKYSQILNNRLRILRKSVPFLGHGDQSQADLVISNLMKLPGMSQYFLPFRIKMAEQAKRTALFRYTRDHNDVNKIFVYLMDYLFKHQKEVQTCFQGNYVNTDYFSPGNLDYFEGRMVPFQKTESCYEEPKNEFEVRKCTLRNTVHGALVYRKEYSVPDASKAISLQAYKIYQKFSNDVLKNLIEEMRRCRMIQMRKRKGPNFFHSYRLSLNYVNVQNVPWWYESAEQAHKTFLDLKYRQKIDFGGTDADVGRRCKFGQLLGINEALSFTPLDAITFDIKFPEYHLVLNPDIEDHSEVIRELAKRYHAKLANEIRESEKAAEASAKNAENDADNDDDVEMVEISPPQPSTSQQQQQQPGPIGEPETISLDDEEALDLTMSAKQSAAIDNLKHWISDCIDLDRVRSPSPELFNFNPIKTEVKTEEDDSVHVKEESEEPRRLFSVEEIVEEMLKPSTSPKEPRPVPYVSDLVSLLFTIYEEGDIKTDELKSLALVKKHFVKKYPRTEKITLEGLEGHYLADHVENRSSIKDVWVKVEKESFVGQPSDKAVALDELHASGGDVHDLTVAYETLQFIEDQGLLGAAGYEIKDKFINREGRCSLESILKILTEHHLVLRTGVTSVRYVHWQYRDSWLTETFRLTNQIPEPTEGDVVECNPEWYRVNPFPWTNIEGAFDQTIFKMWMCNVFSHCVERLKVTFTDLCAKFCFLRPYDVFYLVEKLQEIGVLEVRKYFFTMEDAFSEYELPEEGLASPLDRFEDMYIETHNVGFTMLGSFFNSI